VFWEIGSFPDLLKVWREIAAEFFGTTLFVFLGTSSISALTVSTPADPATILMVAICFGFAYSTLTLATGGHLNPAVTIAAFVGMKISLLYCLARIIAQLLGAIFGSALLKGCLPDTLTSKCSFGATKLASSITLGEGVLVELVITCILVITIFSTAKKHSNHAKIGKFNPIAVGFVMTACHIVAYNVTNSSMNPARSFGPSVLSGEWSTHWVYWVGPTVGGIFGMCITRYILIPHSPKRGT